MKNFIILGLSAVVLFAASAALSLYLTRTPESGTSETDQEKQVVKKPPEKKSNDNRDSSAAMQPLTALPESARPEETVQLISRLRERATALDQREQDIRKREQRMDLILEDIRGERTTIEGVRKKVADELKAVNDRVGELEQRANQVKEERAAAARNLTDIQKRQTEFEAGEKPNINRMASAFDSMAPESAALILKQMADSNKLDTAVKLLSQMKERNVAKVLAELNDPTLASQLLERLRGLKRDGTSPTSAPAGTAPPVSPLPGT